MVEELQYTGKVMEESFLIYVHDQCDILDAMFSITINDRLVFESPAEHRILLCVLDTKADSTVRCSRGRGGEDSMEQTNKQQRLTIVLDSSLKCVCIYLPTVLVPCSRFTENLDDL